MARLSSERAAVQSPLVRYATEAGWTYIDPEEALRLRQGENSPILLDVFIQRVQALNPGIVDHLRAEDLAKRLQGAPGKLVKRQAFRAGPREKRLANILSQFQFQFHFDLALTHASTITPEMSG